MDVPSLRSKMLRLGRGFERCLNHRMSRVVAAAHQIMLTAKTGQPITSHAEVFERNLLAASTATAT